MSDAPMVIIGAGECGVRAALTLRDMGHAGPVTLVGAEPHPPYERPPLSKGGDVRMIAGGDALADIVDFRRGVQALEIDRDAHRVRLSDGSAATYGKLLLATGARARTLPGLESALTLRTRDDAARLREAMRPGARLTLIGGGFIGLEVAATARKAGCDVTVIEAGERLLMRAVPEGIAAALQARHEAEGVIFRLGAQVTGVEGGVVQLADGKQAPADVIVVGIGAEPETDLAAAAGLAIENGVAVDAKLATSDPDIYAAGDCASLPHGLYGGRRLRFESWRVAQDHGALAARNMLGANDEVSAAPWFWSDQYDLTLQVVGMSDGAEHHVRRDLSDDAFVLFHVAQDGRLLGASGLGPGGAVAKTIKLAEMLINRRAAPAHDALSDPAINLKKLLAA